MSKIVTLRLDDPVYRLFKDVAERENRPVSNFIETAVLRFMQEHETVDEFEMAEIPMIGPTTPHTLQLFPRRK